MIKMAMIFGKSKKTEKLLIMSFICFANMQIIGQSKDANIVFVQAEEKYNEKNYNEALSKLQLYENLSSASKEKAQVLKIQIYRELALKDKSQVVNYNNSIEELKKMYSDGKKINVDDLYRILKEQQEFGKDAITNAKDDLSSSSSEINIDGIKIGMNIEEIPSQIAANFDWNEGVKGQANNQMNYVPLIFTPKKAGTGSGFNFKLAGIQNIIADDRTRRVIEVFKFTENGKYKEKDKTGLSKYNSMVEELKVKYGKSNITENPVRISTSKIMNREMTTESYSTILRSKSVTYTLTYSIVNGDNYSIIEMLCIPDYLKN